MEKGGWRRKLPEDPLGVLPEVPEEHFPESFRKKGSSGSNQTSSGRLPEKPLPGTFRKKWFIRKNSGRRALPEELSKFRKTFPEEPLLPECFRKWFFCFFFVFFFKFFLNRNCFVFFKWIILFILVILFFRFYEKWSLGFWCHIFFII